jgi:hypothetical protein
MKHDEYATDTRKADHDRPRKEHQDVSIDLSHQPTRALSASPRCHDNRGRLKAADGWICSPSSTVACE